VADSVNATGNAVYGNQTGFEVEGISFSGPIAKNNIFGSGLFTAGPTPCGLLGGVAGLVAANNYWGAATGPGIPPADDACNPGATVTAFATKPFTVKAPIKP
jgi:hypothetical protein